MKFQPDRAEGVNMITRHEPGRIWVAAQAFDGGVVVPWRGDVEDWQARSAAQLGAAHFERLLRLRPELVVYGSGLRLAFPPTALLRPLLEAGIGVETMDTAAACRTYNVLVAEHRRAVAVLLPAA